MSWNTLYITGKSGFKEEVLESLEDSNLPFMPGSTGYDQEVSLFWIDDSLPLRDIKKAIGSKIVFKYRLRFFTSLEELQLEEEKNTTLTPREEAKIHEMNEWTRSHNYLDAALNKFTPITNDSLSVNTASNITFNLIIAEATSHKSIGAQVSLTSPRDEEPAFKEVSSGSYQAEINAVVNDRGRYKLQVSNDEYIPYSTFYDFKRNKAATTISDTFYLDNNYNQVLTVYLEINSDTPKTFEKIRQAEQIMNTSPTIKMEIIGHTDNIGEAGCNIGLSKWGSETVKKYLVGTGIDPARVSFVAGGAEKPIADHNKREGRRLNRRIEFAIIEK